MLGNDEYGNNTLHAHLVSDDFFKNDKHLHIIDDYHVKEIREEAINFYLHAFERTNCRSITIYYQVFEPTKIDNKLSMNEKIQIYADRINVSASALKSFLLLTTKNKKILSRLARDGIHIEELLINALLEEHTHNRFDIECCISKILDFSKKMADIGITVKFQAYNNLNFNPPFHGRYWLNSKKGYIVDGSLNTFGSGKIFAQLMDDENYRTIHTMLIENVIPNAVEFEPLSFQEIKDIQTGVCNDLGLIIE